jgi:DNA modification methylase
MKKIVKLKLSELAPNTGQIPGLPINPRQWTKGDVDRIAASLKETPELLEARPVLVIPHDGKYVILGGNLRYEGARANKEKEVPAIIFPEDTPVEKLKEVVIKDNGAFGAWDYDALANEWDDLPLGDWGVPAWETESEDKPLEGEASEDEFDETDAVEQRCKAGDIWQLGEHRLMCGDSTDAAQVALLMNGERADIAFTSPPYNLGASKMSDKCPNRAMNNGTAYKEYDDNVSDDEYTELIEKSLGNALDFTDDAMFNIGILKSSKDGIIRMMYDFKDRFCDIIVWNKSQSMPLGLPSHAGCVGHRCELIFCFNKNGNRAFSHPQWKHGAQINRIDTGNASGNEYAKQHAATFPVALPFEVIKAFTDSSVLDLFGGTGTTMIAAEQLGRKCFMMELDPHYCDVILARWEKLTGQTATKI